MQWFLSISHRSCCLQITSVGIHTFLSAIFFPTLLFNTKVEFMACIQLANKPYPPKTICMWLKTHKEQRGNVALSQQIKKLYFNINSLICICCIQLNNSFPFFSHVSWVDRLSSCQSTKLPSEVHIASSVVRTWSTWGHIWLESPKGGVPPVTGALLVPPKWPEKNDWLCNHSQGF